MNWELTITILSLLLGSSLLTAVYNALTGHRAKRRSLYSKGLYLISEREELYYMILRRKKGVSDKLVELMHKNQMQLKEHEALLLVDSYWLGRSYAKLVGNFRHMSEQKFRDAWESPLKHQSDSVPEDRRINSSPLVERYAKDCRRRLNPVRSFYNTCTRWCRG